MKRQKTYAVEAPMRFIFHVAAEDADAAENLLREKLGKDCLLCALMQVEEQPRSAWQKT
jgi:hypothetical protein